MKNKIYRAVLVGVLLTLAQFPAFTQEPEKNSNLSSEWIRLQSDNGEFSVEMPHEPTYFYDQNGFYYPHSTFADSNIHYAEMQLLNASDGKTVMSVEIYKLNSPQKGIDVLLETQKAKGSKLKDLPEGLSGKQSEKFSVEDYVNKKEVDVSYVSRFIASKSHLYVVTAANRGAKTAAFEKFFSSIRLGENQTGNAKISSLKALTINNLAVDAATLAKSPKPTPNQIDSKTREPNPTPFLILARPYVNYMAARNASASGTIRLRVTFEKTGRISQIAFLTSLDNGLNRSAFFAALRIKFIPHEKDGAPETVSRTIEYTFTIG